MNSQSDRDELIARMLGPEGPELTCEECFDRLDEYVEAELAQGAGSAEQLIPGMRAHLHGCPACEEDHESLLAYMKRDSQGAD